MRAVRSFAMTCPSLSTNQQDMEPRAANGKKPGERAGLPYDIVIAAREADTRLSADVRLGGALRQHVGRMIERGAHLALVETGAVVTIDQQRDAARAVDMPRPSERLVERAELLVEELILLKRRDRLGTARTDINAIAH